MGEIVATTSTRHLEEIGNEELEDYVTFVIKDQMFGIPVLGVQDILSPDRIASIPLAFAQTRARDRRNICTGRLERLYDALSMYRARHGTLPTSLTELVDARYIPSAHLVCPARDDLETGYFYLLRAMSNISGDQGILACDLRGNHSDSRGVLFANGDCFRYREDEFQELLQLPVNAVFAQALAAAQAR